MANNKIIFNSQVLLDLTEDTITPDVLKHDITAHDKSGKPIVGSSWLFPLDPFYYDYNIGYVDNGTWKYENPTKTYTDIYEAKAGHNYFISLGGEVGTRFRVMFTTEDVTTKTSGNVTGTRIYNINTPASYASTNFSCTEDGYILVAKDNIGHSGLFSYVIDKTLGFV